MFWWETGVRGIFSKVCSCCLFVFEKFLAYLNRNAYIEIAMRGCNFFEGGKRAFSILGSNAMRVAAINSVGDFVLFMGKVSQ
ncbi:hypothetical protein B566_EDAN017664 [Ephemera danica]|nr:hypothetical protein B566_EDAN017664 [Ephemera danica]